MSVTSFIPEVWSAALLESLKKSLVYGGLCNRNYEGEIAQFGDTVHITSVGRPTISTYTPNSTTITPETLTTADRTLTITQAEFFAFQIDDVDKRQVRGSVMDMAMVEAAYGLRDKVDQFIAAKYVDIQAANVIATVAVTTGDIAYTQLTKLAQKLDEANVPPEGRWAVIPPWFKQLLIDSNRIAANPDAGTAREAIVNGFVGRLAGFDLYVSNNTPLITGDDYAVIGGTNAAITFADQIPVDTTEAYRSQTSFADVVRGMHLYGAKVIRPDGLAYITASQT